MDDDAAREDGPGLLVQDPLEVLPAVAVGLGVLDPQVVVHVLPPGDKVEPVERAMGPGAVEHGGDVVANDRPADGHGV